MEISSVTPTFVSGNPTDDEIAAVSAAITYLLAQSVDGPVDTDVDSMWNWSIAHRNSASENSCSSGNTGDWVKTHRLLSRK